MSTPFIPQPELPLILASASPRRRALLKRLGLKFVVHAAAIDETEFLEAQQNPETLAVKLAAAKARAVGEDYRKALIVGADTIVSVEGMILGKPENAEEAEEMLWKLSGRRHEVTTGVALYYLPSRRLSSFPVTTEVCFRDLNTDEIRRYVATGEPMDKAGAYGIQGLGAVLVRQIRGDYFNVVGFPLTEFYRALKDE